MHKKVKIQKVNQNFNLWLALIDLSGTGWDLLGARCRFFFSPFRFCSSMQINFLSWKGLHPAKSLYVINLVNSDVTIKLVKLFIWLVAFTLDPASSSGASFYAWQRRARNEWLVMNRKGPWEGYRRQAKPVVSFSPSFARTFERETSGYEVALDQNLRNKTEIFAQTPQLYVGDREKVSGFSHWEWWKTLQSSGAVYLSKLIFANVIMTESNRKLINFNSPWTKTLYQINLKNIAFFFAFFKV